jgi:arylsulfatase A-like enzyme
MKFNHCYVTNSICTPSRAAILCGTYNHVNGVMTLDDHVCFVGPGLSSPAT